MAVSFADYKNEYIKQTLAAQKEAAAKELEAAYQKKLAALDQQQSKTRQQYLQKRNETQGAYEQDLKHYGEYANASGIGSGGNAQARIAYGNRRQGNLSSLAQGEANALQTIAQNRTDTTNAYQSDAAGLAADYGAKEYDALYQAWQDEVNQERSDRSYYYQIAMSLLQGGKDPSDETLARAGIDVETAKAIKEMFGENGVSSSVSWKGSGSRSSSGGGSSGSGSSTGSGSSGGTGKISGLNGDGLSAYARSIYQSIRNSQNLNLTEQQRKANRNTALGMLNMGAIRDGKMSMEEYEYLMRALMQ